MADDKKSDVVWAHPWVSYVLTLALLGGSMAILATSPNVDEEIGKSPEMLEARVFFERNPEVELNGRIVQWIGSEHVRDIRAKHRQRRDAGSVAVLSPRMRAKTQKKFDKLQKQAFASLERLPAWRFGVVNRDSGVANTFLHLATHESAVAVGVSIVFFAIAALSLEGAWGSLLFGGFMLLLPFLSSITYTSLNGEEGAPWIGPSAVLAAMLGAYAVRGIRGFMIPFWVVVPVWVFCEYVLVRDLGLDSFDTTPLLVQGVGFVFGAAVAGAIWAAKLEEIFHDRGNDTPDLVSNPVLEQAIEERTHGNPEAAFDLLVAELKRTPSNHDAAIALWETSTGTDRARRAVPALLGAIRDGLRKGRREDALGLWLALAAEVGIPKTDCNLLVRVGEALLVDEEYEPALDAFKGALNGPKHLSPVLALRVARSARDLDRALAARAAEIALADDQLGDSERAELEALRRANPASSSARTSEEDSLAPSIGESDLVTEGLDPLQDPHAIAADDFEELPEGESLAAEDESQWNEPGLVEDLSAELSEDSAGFDWSGLQDEPGGDGATPESEPEVDTSVELGSDSSDVSETTETLEPGANGEPDDPYAISVGVHEAEPLVAPRVLRVRTAVPVLLGDEALSLDIEGAGKTDLPYARIEAVAAGAVHGLADRPVLVVDIVLNWMALPHEPLKVIRIRSDAFDPRKLVPDPDSAIQSLRAMLDQLLARSGGAALPSRDAALGNPFETFPDIASYDRTVLLIQ